MGRGPTWVVVGKRGWCRARRSVHGVTPAPLAILPVGLGLVAAAVLVARLRLAGRGATRKAAPRPAGHATGPGVSGGPRSER